MSFNHRLICTLLVLVTTLMAPACSSTGVGNPDLTSEESALVSDGQDGTRTGDTSNSVAAVPLLNLDTAAKVATPEIAATNAGDAVRAFSPAGCATQTHVAGTSRVTYTFSRVGVLPCRGPSAGEAFEGTIDATFASTAPGAVDLTVQSTDLRLDGVSVTHQSTLHVTFAAGVRTTHSTSTFTATSARGTVTHQADYTWSYDLSSLCFALDGTSTTTLAAIGGATRTHGSTVKNYVRCGARTACPNANGTIEFTRGDGSVRVLLTFLGGTRYDVYVPSRDVHHERSDLSCTP